MYWKECEACKVYPGGPWGCSWVPDALGLSVGRNQVAARLDSFWRMPRHWGDLQLHQPDHAPQAVIPLQRSQAGWPLTIQQIALPSASFVVLAPTGTDTTTQTELPREYAVSGWRTCLRFLLVSVGVSEMPVRDAPGWKKAAPLGGWVSGWRRQVREHPGVQEGGWLVEP